MLVQIKLDGLLHRLFTSIKDINGGGGEGGRHACTNMKCSETARVLSHFLNRA